MEDFDDALRAPGADGSVNLSHRAYVTLDDQLWGWGSKVLVLNLSYNHIKLLDEGIGNLTHLHTLDVSSNALQGLPAEIGGCVRLRTVRLNGNQLTKLPEEITRCKLIEELVLSENRLTKLPAGIRGMLCLKRLMLANNNLTKLDCSIAQCTVLDEIDVTNNPIANVPEELRGDSAMILWIMRFEFGAFVPDPTQRHARAAVPADRLVEQRGHLVFTAKLSVSVHVFAVGRSFSAPLPAEKSNEYSALLGDNSQLEDQAKLTSKLKLDIEALKERIVELEEENLKLLEERPHCYLAMRDRCRDCMKKACMIM
jgi:hypothetical protein